MTDKQISAIKDIVLEDKNKKKLKPWIAEEQIDQELLENDFSDDQQFDQFAANAKLNHNMEDFNEDEYTT